MSFLQPLVLAALPLAVLPLVIHLINQRRFQTMPWAAMRFLLAAKALSRGYSRLRHWLIMLMRMAAVAAVILAVGRPLSRGWLALAGGSRPDTAIVILDRSPSMQARDPAVPDTKLETGRRQLAEALATLRASRVVLVTDPARPPLEVSPGAIPELAAAGPAAVPADMPLFLQAAYDHVRDSAAGATEIWICSDQRANDWSAEDGAWGGLRDAFARLPQQVRFQLVSFADPVPGNVAIRVTAARLERRGDDRDLVVSVAASRPDGGEPVTLPVTFEIRGASSTVELEVAGREAALKDHVIPLGRAGEARGWGRVSIPADADAADNEFFFTFDEPPRRVALVVVPPAGGESPTERSAREVLALVAGIAPEKDQEAEAVVVETGALASADWESTALVLWQADLPEGPDAELVERFVARGGQVIFFPPDSPSDRAFAGLSWTGWVAHPEPLAPATWRTDQDLLANTLSAGALPVGGITVNRSCGLAGDHVPLAALPDGTTLVGRAAEGRGGVYVCATRPTPRDSSLAAEGVVLYALVQRACDRGAAVLGAARQVDAGPAATALMAAPAASDWTRLAGPAAAPSNEPGLHAGVFAAGSRLLAVNRPAAEDAGRILPDERVDGLFAGLPVMRISGRAGSGDSLVQEIWRAFLIAMLLALIAEGLLCMPRPAAASATPGRLLEAAA